MSAGGGVQPGPETFEGRLFRMGKAGTIALVVVIVAALAGVGILAGALAGQSTPTPVRGTRDAPMINPGGATATGSAAAPQRTFGREFRPGGVLAAAGLAAVPGVLPQLSPSPVEASPVEATPTPTQTPATPPSTIDLDGVPLPVPEGWGVLAYGPNWARITNGHNFAFAEVDSNIDPASDVPQLTRGVYQFLVSSNAAYSGLPDPESLTVDEYQPFGGLVGRAGLFYWGIYTDQQAAYDLAGQLYVSLRQDGKAMVLLEEVVPMFDWDAEWNAACPSMYRPVIEAFAGESYPYDPCG